jgi:hypothetical protein
MFPSSMLQRESTTSVAQRAPLPAIGIERAARIAGIAIWALLAAAALALALVFSTQPQYDSMYSLLWGREIADGQLPGFETYRGPTPHPLLLAVSVLLGPLGDTGGRIVVALCCLSVVALAIAAFRLGRVAAGVLGGALAAGLIATRLNLWLLASIGFLDVPYLALVGWAAALEAERPRRGGAVWVLLALAGLLRPEAWILAAIYALWIGWPGGLGGLVRAGANAAVAPALWMAVDLVVTGAPLFSLQHTDALALELQRERPLTEIPGLALGLLEEIVKLPVLLAAAGGGLAAVALRRRELAVPAVLVAATCGTYAIIATGGLPSVYRYLLNAGTGLVVLAAFGLAGWTQLPRSSPWRLCWAVPAIALLVAGGAWTAAKTNPGKARIVLQDRVDLRRDLRAALTSPAALDARRCGPISVPNHKLIPEVRSILSLPDGAVIARSQRSRAPQRTGLALVIDRRIERLPALDIYEVPHDGGAILQVPPPGFRLLGGNRSFAAYGAC